MKALVVGAPGSGKTTLAKWPLGYSPETFTAIDLDSIGYHGLPATAAMSERIDSIDPVSMPWLIRPSAIRALLDQPGNLVCLGMSNNMLEPQAFLDPYEGRIRSYQAIIDMGWDVRIAIVWDPEYPGEYERRFGASRDNRWGKDPRTRKDVTTFAKRLYEEGVGKCLTLDATGQTVQQTADSLNQLLRWCRS